MGAWEPAWEPAYIHCGLLQQKESPVELNSIMGRVLQSRQELERVQQEKEVMQARLSTLGSKVHFGSTLDERLKEVSKNRLHTTGGLKK
jgi:hypothetical protein